MSHEPTEPMRALPPVPPSQEASRGYWKTYVFVGLLLLTAVVCLGIIVGRSFSR